ncbi:hypothetical protein GCM10011491_30470 [Brucella endophytica]|uniref:Uncharacterized protein n=1 Tax=Brucella endophytica TaxID=1963359 RepID=A0A916WIC6_9HYPH|nr:hypothetical protein GCM10011491_30470 [Brucella endophytica]
MGTKIDAKRGPEVDQAHREVISVYKEMEEMVGLFGSLTPQAQIAIIDQMRRLQVLEAAAPSPKELPDFSSKASEKPR